MVERYMVMDHVTTGLDPETWVRSKDVVISPESGIKFFFSSQKLMTRFKSFPFSSPILVEASVLVRHLTLKMSLMLVSRHRLVVSGGRKVKFYEREGEDHCFRLFKTDGKKQALMKKFVPHEECFGGKNFELSIKTRVHLSNIRQANKALHPIRPEQIECKINEDYRHFISGEGTKKNSPPPPFMFIAPMCNKRDLEESVMFMKSLLAISDFREVMESMAIDMRDFMLLAK
ncbi:unnamed protein product [Dovyalis caffra]|uniref:Uncharacterized protein n=1 Tax=Dovyalis caffra TaxID=77055 RepID=A0AAV1RAL9_9ROSI|nr:unnamed protein product [Dovyalis caffra]